MTTRIELDQWVANSGQVSDQQREAICADGNFFLLSRPGSGKTRTVGIRAARLALQDPLVRVAATSYTNVAIRQIEATIRERGVALASCHFTGTLHQFLLNYVLYPHAGLLKIKQPFNLIEDETWSKWPTVIYNDDPKKRLSIADLHYSAAGAFRVHAKPAIGITREAAETTQDAQVRQRKLEARQRGLVSFSDAMFYAQKILEDNPPICAAVARRFDEIIVDEAQDTSDVQLRCLELIHATGQLKSLVLIGDTDQSIYGFNGADPELCKALVMKLGLTQIPMTQNFRSSQLICNVTCRFCGRTEADEAVGPHRECKFRPEILIYDHTDPASGVALFQARLQHHGIKNSRAVVLTRGRAFRDKINGLQRLDGMHRLTLALGRLAAARAEGRTLDREELRHAEGQLARMAWGDAGMIREGEDHLRMRRELTTLIRKLPGFDSSLDQWIGEAREEVKTLLGALVEEPETKAQYVVKSKADYKNVKTAEVFSTDPAPLLARTVHEVKGESHESVLLVVQPRHGANDQAGLWAQPLLGEEVEEEQQEELRIAYVALTRAERYCAVALPANVEQSIIDAYLDVGFVAV